MKRVFLIFQLFIFVITSSCKDVDNIIIDNEITDDVTLNEEIELIDLNNKIFLNVLNSDKMIIPLKIYNLDIIWEYDKDYLKLTENQVSPIKDGKTKIIANINEESVQFFVEIKDLKYTKTVQYGLNFHYMFITDSKKMGSKLDSKQIVLHNTANTAPAINEIKWLGSKDNTSSTSFHYAVDDTGVYQAIPTDIIAHHAGNKATNYQAIGIEIAKSMVNDENIKDDAIHKGAQLIALLMSYYQIDISNVITHYDASGKYCPHDIFDRFTIDKFYQIIEQKKTF